MHEDRCPHRRTVLQELHDSWIIQIAFTHVVADFHTSVPIGQTPIEFSAGSLRVVQRHLAEGDETVRCLGAHLRGEVIEDPRDPL